MVADSDIQRIAKLTPLSDVLASFDLSIGPVAPREETLAKAVGLTLAADLVIADGRPRAALALRDGFAVRSEATQDSSSYAPVLLAAAIRINTGEAMPEGTDAVAPLATLEARDGKAEALAPVTPGDGVLLPDTDTTAHMKIRLSGARLRHIDVALLGMLGIERVLVRQPRVRIVCTSDSEVIRGAARLIALA